MHDEAQDGTGKTGEGTNEQHAGSQDEAERTTGPQESRISEEAEKTKKLAEIAGGGSNKGSWSGSNEDLDQADRRSPSTDS
jgi:hypothetical protein